MANWQGLAATLSLAVPPTFNSSACFYYVCIRRRPQVRPLFSSRATDRRCVWQGDRGCGQGHPDTIDEKAALRSLTIPLRAQGATFNDKGRLWVSQSSGGFGTLSIFDPTNGNELRRYETAIGVEDLSFDRHGQLWTVSEAGSIRWSKWHQFFPVLYRLDVSKLK